MEIVKMTMDHAPQVAALETVCFSDPWSLNAISSEVTNALSYWLVALDGERVAGYIGSQSVLGEADMMNLAVSPDYRRQGIGQKLVERLICDLKERGTHILVLEVRASNESAISLYQKLGFVQVGRRPNYYYKPREDALILRKEWSL